MSDPKTLPRLADFWIRLVKEKPLGTFSGIIIVILLLVAIFADVLAPYSYKEIHLVDRLAGPSSQYLLGTDQAGRDLLSRLLFGARISVLVGVAATALNIVVAVLIGGTSGFLGGRLDLAVQRFVDAWMAFPGLLLLLTIMSIVGRGLPQIVVVLGIAGGISGSRVMRSAVIGIKENDYFLAAQAVGTPTSRILSHHVLPNIMAPVIIVFSIEPILQDQLDRAPEAVARLVLRSSLAVGARDFRTIRDVPLTVPLEDRCKHVFHVRRDSRPFGANLIAREHKMIGRPVGRAQVVSTRCGSIAPMTGDAVRDLLDPMLRGGGEPRRRRRGLIALIAP